MGTKLRETSPLQVPPVRAIRVAFSAGLLLFLATALWNIGIIGMDDYYDVIAFSFPVQNQVPSEMLNEGSFRSPVPRLILWAGGQVAYQFFGFHNPAHQLRFGLAVFAIFAFFAHALFGMGQLHQLDKSQDLKFIYLVLLGFFFVSPLMLTRPMIESFCAPFLMGSCYFACRYHQKPAFKPLFWGAVFVITAWGFRYQAVVCAPVLALLAIWHKRYKDLLWLALIGGVGFFITGLVDWWSQGTLHARLWTYLSYPHSSHGVMPFYVYILLFVGLTLPPTFLFRYKNFEWKKRYGALLPTLLYFFVFLGVHTFVGHKEERFMIPMLPFFMVLLTPLVYHLVSEVKTRWRVAYFVGLNVILLFFVTVNIPQNNVIGMAQYLHHHPEITGIVEVDDSVVLFPQAFIVHSVTKERLASKDVVNFVPIDCQKVLAIRSGYKDRVPDLDLGWKPIAIFKPGLLENLVVQLNPKQNARRSAIELYGAKTCSYEEG